MKHTLANIANSCQAYFANQRLAPLAGKASVTP